MTAPFGVTRESLAIADFSEFTLGGLVHSNGYNPTGIVPQTPRGPSRGRNRFASLTPGA